MSPINEAVIFKNEMVSKNYILILFFWYIKTSTKLPLRSAKNKSV